MSFSDELALKFKCAEQEDEIDRLRADLAEMQQAARRNIDAMTALVADAYAKVDALRAELAEAKTVLPTRKAQSPRHTEQCSTPPHHHQEPIMSESEQNSLGERSPEQREFEQWYVENSFNYARDPIGSINCYLQWLAWNSSRGRLLADLTALRAANEELRKELEAARADAARYQWLRHGDNDEKVLCNGPVAKDYWYLLRLGGLDAAIDAAIAQEAKAPGADHELF